MSIPLVNTAIAPSGALPAHPAPTAEDMNISQLSVDANGHIAHEISTESSLIQVHATGDVLFYSDKNGDAFTPDFGMPLTAGGYFSFSVRAGSTLYFSSQKNALVYVLEG